MKAEELEEIFTYHPPAGNQPERYTKVRAAMKESALVINDLCPESREKSLALTNLQNASMWANAAIALGPDVFADLAVGGGGPRPFLSVEDVAKICHQANKALCEANGDDSQLDWDQAPEWQRTSAINGVGFTLANPDAPASANHESWYAEKEADGWVYGETKDAIAKTHPCMVPYDQLPSEQQAKDHLFRGIVNGLRPYISIAKSLSAF